MGILKSHHKVTQCRVSWKVGRLYKGLIAHLLFLLGKTYKFEFVLFKKIDCCAYLSRLKFHKNGPAWNTKLGLLLPKITNREQISVIHQF